MYHKDIILQCSRHNGILEEVLYIPPVDSMKERWFGKMVHAEEVEPLCGIKEVRNSDEYEGFFTDREDVISKLRANKCEEEIDNLKKAIEITADGIQAILKAVKPEIFEYNLRAEFEKVLADNGVHEPAFETIVGAGKNSLCLHYNEEDCILNDGDIVLCDLGARYNSMCADVTRVIPINGKYSRRQRELVTLACDCIDYVCANLTSGMTIKELNAIQDEFLEPRLKEIGLNGEVKDYRWHSISHHLGLDTHDVCGRGMPIAENSVFTLEVGIYVESWNEGVRIEDDIVIKNERGVNLTRFIPRNPDEIENEIQNIKNSVL